MADESDDIINMLKGIEEEIQDGDLYKGDNLIEILVEIIKVEKTEDGLFIELK